MSVQTGANHIREALSSWLAHQADAILIGEAVTDLLAAHPSKVLHTPIGDRSLVGLGLGLAMAGKRVVVELTSTRDLLAATGILTDASRISSTEFAPNLTVRVPYAQGLGAQSEPSIGDLLCRLDGVGVHVGCSETFSSLLSQALSSGIHVLFETTADYQRRAESVPATLGQARLLRDGAHITLVGWGASLPAALDAADTLASEGIEAAVFDAVTLSSLDPAIGAHVQKTGRIVTVHSGDSNFSDRVQSNALRSAFLYLESPPSDCYADANTVVQTARQSVHF